MVWGRLWSGMGWMVRYGMVVNPRELETATRCVEGMNGRAPNYLIVGACGQVVARLGIAADAGWSLWLWLSTLARPLGRRQKSKKKGEWERAGEVCVGNFCVRVWVVCVGVGGRCCQGERTLSIKARGWGGDAGATVPCLPRIIPENRWRAVNYVRPVR